MRVPLVRRPTSRHSHLPFHPSSILDPAPPSPPKRCKQIISVPWKAQSVGQRTTVKAELVDVYKTLAELAGLGPVEQGPGGVQGTSLAAVFDSPGSPPPELAGKVAYSQIARCSCGPVAACGGAMECDANACAGTPVAQFDYLGYTMRTERWRFTAWPVFDNSTMRVDWGRTAGLELYDLQGDDGSNFDFDGYNRNVAAEHNDTVAELLQQLRAAVDSWPFNSKF